MYTLCVYMSNRTNLIERKTFKLVLLNIKNLILLKDTMFSNLKVGNRRASWAALRRELVPITLKWATKHNTINGKSTFFTL